AIRGHCAVAVRRVRDNAVLEGRRTKNAATQIPAESAVADRQRAAVKDATTDANIPAEGAVVDRQRATAADTAALPPNKVSPFSREVATYGAVVYRQRASVVDATTIASAHTPTPYRRIPAD